MGEQPEIDSRNMPPEVGSRAWYVEQGAQRQATRATAQGGEKTVTYGDMVMERVNTISEAQRALLKDAVDRGVPAGDLPALIADAMNAGNLSMVVEGLRLKGGMSLILFNGPVPPEAIDVEAGYVINHYDKQGPPRFKSHVMFDDRCDETQLDHEWLSVPMSGGGPVDTAVLAKIDTHMMLPPAEQV